MERPAWRTVGSRCLIRWCRRTSPWAPGSAFLSRARPRFLRETPDARAPLGPAFQTHRRSRGPGLGSVVPNQARAPRWAEAEPKGVWASEASPCPGTAPRRSELGGGMDAQGSVDGAERSERGGPSGRWELGQHSPVSAGQVTDRALGPATVHGVLMRVGPPGGSSFIFWGLGQVGAHASYRQTHASSKRSYKTRTAWCDLGLRAPRPRVGGGCSVSPCPAGDLTHAASQEPHVQAGGPSPASSPAAHPSCHTLLALGRPSAPTAQPLSLGRRDLGSAQARAGGLSVS